MNTRARNRERHALQQYERERPQADVDSSSFVPIPSNDAPVEVDETVEPQRNWPGSSEAPALELMSPRSLDAVPHRGTIHDQHPGVRGSSTQSLANRPQSLPTASESKRHHRTTSSTVAASTPSDRAFRPSPPANPPHEDGRAPNTGGSSTSNVPDNRAAALTAANRSLRESSRAEDVARERVLAAEVLSEREAAPRAQRPQPPIAADASDESLPSEVDRDTRWPSRPPNRRRPESPNNFRPTRNE